MKRWITADWHLGEGRFEIVQRPGFDSPEHMVDHFVGLHNELVAPDDEVIVVGDAVNQTSPEYLKEVARFNGIKTLIRGNHDKVFSDEELGVYFDRIVPEGEGIFVDIENATYYVTHYPTKSKEDFFNLVGHIHSAWKVQLNALNVGVDVHNYRPIDMDKDVPFLYGAVSNFYDEDVWIAYDQSQSSYFGLRGKKGRYFQ